MARSLGLDEQTVHVLIVNPGKETYYVMKEDFSLDSLSKFVETFHRQPGDKKMLQKFARAGDQTRDLWLFFSHFTSELHIFIFQE